jgi:putative FmdB family regulatory protein
MPVYGYRCSRGHHFELLQRITEPPVSQCPECQAPATRVFYPVGIIFKGQGFYKTDSRPSSDGSTDSASKPAETKAPDSKPNESKSTDSKPASSSSSSETAKSA